MALTTEEWNLYIKGIGFVKGISILDHEIRAVKCHRLGGIPYALPPTGERRWRRPQPLPKTIQYGTKEIPRNFTGLANSNIWIPAGRPPSEDGWPVWVYLHGGFLQFGSPNKDNPSDLLYGTDVKCIIVIPGYRLNVFGFLASRELLQEAAATGDKSVGNLGFWDQRLALEWTFENIEAFGGNKHNITLGGYSAGAYSTFHQLAYDIGLPEKSAVIRRAIMWSNGPGIQPKNLPEAQEQFDSLIAALGISPASGDSIKLARLRSVPSSRLLAALKNTKLNYFRAITDGLFVRRGLFQEISDGSFAEKLLKRGIKLMIGDLLDEANLYKRMDPPSSYEALVDRLGAEYSRTLGKVLARTYCPNKSFPNGSDWTEVFGQIYSDVQVYVTARGFITALARMLPLEYVLRYRINWRAEGVDRIFPKQLGVIHTSDLAIWFYGNGSQLTPSEQRLVGEFLRPLAAFLKGDQVIWGTKRFQEARAITGSGSIEVRPDTDWDRSQPVWKALQTSTSSRL